MTKRNSHILSRIAFVVAVLALIYVASTAGVFKIYAHLFSEKHLHRQNFMFRLWFVGAFSVVNYFYFVPRFYMQKRYTFFCSIALFCLVMMLILPEFVIKQPKFEPQGFADGRPFSPLPQSPIPVPLFEMVNMILLFSISIFASIVLQTRRSLGTIEPQNAEIKPIIEHKNEEKPTLSETASETPQETALTLVVNYSLIRIEFSDILYIKSMDNYLHFYLKDKKPILVRMTMKEASNKLPTEAFLRVHKSYTVAIAAIESIRNKVILIENQDIPIGRVYEEAVFKVFEK